MTKDTDYLYDVLNSQNLAPDGPEMKALQEQREKVERILRKRFGSSPIIKYGGSKAKGTMIKESYDLDIIEYFPHDDTTGGETLEDIYNNTYEALSADYLVERKGSALRLKDKAPDTYGNDFHIDVVPGRYIDGEDGDVFLYQATGEKKRLKTNLDVHIAHVKDSDVIDAIRLMKLWRVRNRVQIKNFALDLLTIKLLENKKNLLLTNQLVHVWEEFQDHSDSLSIEDPANPFGNDLSEMLNDSVRQCLKEIATSTLSILETNGWEAIFGKVERTTDTDKKASLEAIAASMPPQADRNLGLMIRAPWFQANPNFFQALTEEISQAFPELHFSVRNNIVFLSGNFLLREGNKVIDSFLIEIEFPWKYPNGLPLVFEIGGRIPRTIDSHINPLGDACLFFPPQLVEVLPEGSSLLDFLNGPVKSFFVGQSYYELTKTWLFGEWSHREDAIYDFYAPILKTNDKAIIAQFLRVISNKKIKGHWPCPCGSGKKLRHCHFNEVFKLHHDYQYGMKQWGWRDRTHKVKALNT